MHQKLPTHPTLLHPVSGAPLRAVFVTKTGRVYWPIMGGSEPAPAAPAAPAPPAPPEATYTPPESQADLDRIIETRLARERQRYANYDDLAEKAARLDAIELDLSSDMDKAARQASEDGWNAAMTTTVPRIVRAEFKAEAKGILTDEQLDALLEDVDLKLYADDDGEPDVVKIKAKIERIAPTQQGNEGTRFVRPPISLGQGNQPPSQTKPGDQGRAMAQKRFGNKQQQQ